MEKMEKQATMEGKEIIGIDLHPDSFSAVALCGPTLSCRQLYLDAAVPTKDYPKWLQRRVSSNCIVVFEASSNAFEFAGKAKEVGAKAVILDSRKVGQFRKAYCENDKLAARKIAKCYISGMAEDSEVWQPDERTKTRREIISAHQQAVKDATRGKNRLRSYLNEHGVRLPKGFRMVAPSALNKIYAMYQWSDIQRNLLGIKMDKMLHAENLRSELLAIITNEVKSDKAMASLLSLCGIRAITAFAVVAAVGDINRFASPKKLASYIGLIPCLHQSGNREFRWGMTKYGIRQLKSILIQAAQSIYRSKNRSGDKLKQWGIKMSFRKGKNIAVAAMARKLAVAIWYQLKGYMPAIIEKPQVIRTKLRHIIAEMSPTFFASAGYKSKNDFFEEFCLIMDLHT